jgi:transcriptional regulator with XRE-family HTH domain
MRGANDGPGSIALAWGPGWSATASAFDFPAIIDQTLANPSGRLPPSPGEVPLSAAAAIHTVRRLSGLTWDELADLLTVSRRSLHHWANGRPVSAEHDRRLRQVLAALRRIDHGEAARNRDALLTAGADGRTIVDLLKEGRYAEACDRAGLGSGRARPSLRPLSPEAEAARRPPPPVVLLEAMHDRPVVAGRAIVGRIARPPKRRGS